MTGISKLEKINIIASIILKIIVISAIVYWGTGSGVRYP